MSDAPTPNPTPKVELKEDGTIYEIILEADQHTIKGFEGKRVQLELKFNPSAFPKQWGLWIGQAGENAKRVRELPQTEDLAIFSKAIEAKYGLQNIEWKEKGTRGQIRNVLDR